MIDRLRGDPLAFAKAFWPALDLYDKQRDIYYSVEYNGETNVYSPNMVGKDKIAALCCLRGIICHQEARIITTSVSEDHLRVLWGEIDHYIETSAIPLDSKKGGPLIRRHQEIRPRPDLGYSVKSYLIGKVSKKGEGMAGHHAAWGMAVIDEASGVDDQVWTFAEGWAKKIFAFGNPHECQNRYRRAFKDGDIPIEGERVRWWDGSYRQRYHRLNIRLRAEDTPNVKLALAEIAAGREPSNRVLVPGVLRYRDGLKGYEYRRKHWDAVRQCVGLDGAFYEGAEALLFPPAWLNRAEAVAERVKGMRRAARGLGLDPGEGGDFTAWCVVDEHGIIELVSMQTPNTAVIEGITRDLMRKYNLSPDQVCVDRGGGGKQLVDRMNTDPVTGQQRHRTQWVRTVGFGEAPTLEPRAGKTPLRDVIDNRTDRGAYVNRRAEMYGELRGLLEPPAEGEERGFGIPADLTELRRQLAPIPLWRDGEGRLMLPPKQRRGNATAGDRTVTLDQLIGRSPDEADALVLAVHAMLHRPTQRVGGIVF